VKVIKAAGKNRKHRVLLYTLSTCGWCKLTKKFCMDHEIEYEYIDVDQCSQEEREEIRQDILKRGGRLSYPTIIIDDKILINGFHEDKIKEALEI
jgi:glutaredoxin-like protein NrdH